MKIVILAPSGVPYAVGGAEKLWWGMLEGIRGNTGHEVELLKVPAPERDMRELIASYRYFAGLDLAHFDLVLSTKYPAWMVSHPNHWLYLQHKLRGLYDTYPEDMPAELAPWPQELAPLHELLQREPLAAHRPGLFAELQRLQEQLPEEHWQQWFALPGPLARQLIHWLDASALQPGAIKKYMAISTNVAAREDYFPTDMPVQVIHHPSDLQPAPAGAGEYLFTVSRLDPPKRLDLLVRAMRSSATQLSLLIAGDGPQLQELRELAGDDPRIRLLGRLADSELRGYYSRALCVPFIPVDEDYGLITVEALQAGKPVLTCSDSGGVLELVQPGSNGWVVAPTETALAQAIDQVCADPGVAAAMAPACRDAVAHINWPDTVAALLDSQGLVDAHGFVESGKPRRIVVPLTFPVWPAQSGGTNRVFHLYRHIAYFTPVTLLTLCNHDAPAFDAEIAPGLRELRIPKSVQHQAGERALEQQLGTSVADLYAIEHMLETPAYIQALQELTRQADLVVASHPYLYRAIRSVYRGNVYYEAHNVELDMKRDILGGATAADSWLDLIAATEGACARESVGVSACSREDARRLVELYDLPVSGVIEAPNGVDTAAVPHVPLHARRRVAQRIAATARPAAVFMGSWHGPNIDAVNFILATLAPALPELEFWIVGSVCQFHFDLDAAPDNLVFFGQLSDSDKNAVLSCAQVAINPVQTGSGSNLKMAEYGAAGLPIVSTAFGCRGLDVADFDHLLQAGMEEFAEKLLTVVNHSPQAALNAMSTRVHTAESSGYDWQGIAVSLFGHMVSVCRK